MSKALTEKLIVNIISANNSTLTGRGRHNEVFALYVSPLQMSHNSKLLFVILLAALVIAPSRLYGQLGPSGCPAGSVQPPANLVAWWPLNETSGTLVSDHAFGLNPGTASAPIGSTSNPKAVTGFVGNGLNFFFGSRVTVNPSVSLNFATNMSFTVDAWIKGHPSPIAGNLNTSTRVGYSLYYANNNTLSFDMGTGSSILTWQGPPITPNVWTFVAVVVNRATNRVTLYVGTAGLSVSSPPPVIPSSANASNGLNIGQCSGNPNGCDTIIDELEIFNRALTQTELQTIFNARNAGKCIPPSSHTSGMTWIHATSNSQNGSITVGCGSTGPNPCDPFHGDTLCTQLRPLLCIFKPTPAFAVPAGVINTDQNNRWSGGVVATTQPIAGASFTHISATPGTDANSFCAAKFGAGWRVAEFHDGFGWNFQAYGGTVDAPTVPSTRFWVHINDQPAANCWATP